MTTPSERAMACADKILDMVIVEHTDAGDVAIAKQIVARLIDDYVEEETRELRALLERWSEVKRYDLGKTTEADGSVHCEMWTKRDGHYVLATDYLAAIAERDAALAELADANRRANMSSEVNRYDTPVGWMRDDQDGDYVAYSDYAAAIAERDALRAEVERLKPNRGDE
jgi:hypothetical protein